MNEGHDATGRQERTSWTAVDAGQQQRERVDRLLSALVLLVVVLVGVPQVWQRLSTGGLGLELVFYPLLGAAFLVLLLRRRGR